MELVVSPLCGAIGAEVHELNLSLDIEEFIILTQETGISYGFSLVSTFLIPKALHL